jgi:tubulin polyglutamylase TTLL5
MQHSKGFRNFNIIPKTFMIPNEISLFQEYYRKFKGVWIVKPCGLSRGRGIYLIDHINQLNKTTGSSLVISQYIQPFCINGFKFDLRLYVAVTSYDPLRIYLFKEGLGRFAAEPYHKDDISNLCIHLTNYSINKYNPNFVSSDDGEREDCGNKWSLSAIFRYLKKQGHNVEKLLMSIEDIVIKTIISAEHHIADPVKNPHNDRCFELFGFDIMLDKSLQPWLLEVNLSPSLTCDSPLDTKIKSNLITDLLSLVGLPLYDPCTGKPFHGSVLSEVSSCQASATDSSLSHKDVLMINQTRDEYKRRGNFVRIFPSIDSWELYGCFLEHRTKRNYLLHSQLYPCQSCKIKWPPRPATPIGVVISRRLKRAELIKPHYSITVDDEDESDSRGLCATQRVTVYLKQLMEHDHGSDIVLGKYDGCVANGLNDGDVMTDDCCVNEIPLHSLMKKSKSCTCVVTSNDIITSDDDDGGRDISSTNHSFRSNSVCS